MNNVKSIVFKPRTTDDSAVVFVEKRDDFTRNESLIIEVTMKCYRQLTLEKIKEQNPSFFYLFGRPQLIKI